MTTPEQIYNFKQLEANLATGGQPDENELAAIATAGYAVVINLGLADTPYALAGEQSIVESLGLHYEHIPVNFENPEIERYFTFQERYQQLSQRQCFIHCAANKRVSSFMALYRVIELGWELQAAEEKMLQIWQPNQVWYAFMQRVLTQAGAS
jgi:protein tyrosine phosphatase (PTP) superfamily phosphohydrolase (DUF442 family)